MGRILETCLISILTTTCLVGCNEIDRFVGGDNQKKVRQNAPVQEVGMSDKKYHELLFSYQKNVPHHVRGFFNNSDNNHVKYFGFGPLLLSIQGIESHIRVDSGIRADDNKYIFQEGELSYVVSGEGQLLTVPANRFYRDDGDIYFQFQKVDDKGNIKVDIIGKSLVSMLLDGHPLLQRGWRIFKQKQEGIYLVESFMSGL